MKSIEECKDFIFNKFKDFVCPFCGFIVDKRRIILSYLEILDKEDFKGKVLMLIIKCICGQSFMSRGLRINSKGDIGDFIEFGDLAIIDALIEENLVVRGIEYKIVDK